MFTLGRTVLVTGSTDGIGKEAAKALARQGGRVLVHGRSNEKVKATLAEIRSVFSAAELKGYVADFSSLQAVREMAAAINDDEDELHVLLNNAGTFSPEYQQSKDGYELTFAVNQLAPFYLTLALLDKLKSSQPARIINVTSIAHTVRDLDLDNIHSGEAYKGWGAYKASKLASILFTYELAERLQGSSVTVNCLHPGAVDTKMLRSAFPATQGISLEEGAKTSIYLASSDEVAKMNGFYFENCTPAQSALQTYDQELQKTMWEYCEKWVGWVE